MADPQKPVPDPKSVQEHEALLPDPGHDGYVFFENAANVPLEKSLDFRDRNSWGLMDISYLAYATDGAYAIDQLQKVNLTGAVFGFDRNDPPHILVAHNNDFIVIAFRGTRVQDLPDILADIAFLPESTNNGFVHSGFQKAFLAGGIWDQAKEHVAGIAGDQMILFSGHSLGAALATLARRAYRDPKGRSQALYTFGSPRVGDELIFCPNYPPNAYRIVNDQDLVTHVPTPPLYGHVGTPYGVDGKPLPGDTWNQLEHRFADAASALAVFSLASRKQLLADYFAHQPLQPLIDHAPKSYAAKIWNSL